MAEEIDQEEDQREFEKHRMRFYAMIGHYVTLYQGLEDGLPKVFASALGGGEAKALAVFNLARGLEAKLDAITAALTEASDEQRARWAVLLKRIAKAAESRNQIAHASPVHHAGEITVVLGSGAEGAIDVYQTGRSRMELVKKTKNGQHVWTVDSMEAEYDRTSDLRGYLAGFAMELRGETVPEHLLED